MTINNEVELAHRYLVGGEFPTCQKCVYAADCSSLREENPERVIDFVQCRRTSPALVQHFPIAKQVECCGQGKWFLEATGSSLYNYDDLISRYVARGTSCK